MVNGNRVVHCSNIPNCGGDKFLTADANGALSCKSAGGNAKPKISFETYARRSTIGGPPPNINLSCGSDEVMVECIAPIKGKNSCGANGVCDSDGGCIREAVTMRCLKITN